LVGLGLLTGSDVKDVEVEVVCASFAGGVFLEPYTSCFVLDLLLLLTGFKYSDSQSAIDVFKEVASFIRPMSTEIAYLLIESEVGEGRVTINQVLAQRQAVVSCTKDLEVIQLLINVFALTV